MSSASEKRQAIQYSLSIIDKRIIELQKYREWNLLTEQTEAELHQCLLTKELGEKLLKEMETK